MKSVLVIATLVAVATACRGQAPPTQDEEGVQAPLPEDAPSLAPDPIGATPAAANQGDGMNAEGDGDTPSGSGGVIEEYDVGGSAPEPEDVVEPLPKKKPIAPSGVPIDGPSGDPIEGPSGVPIQGPRGVPIEGTDAVPIESDDDQETDRWGD